MLDDQAVQGFEPMMVDANRSGECECRSYVATSHETLPGHFPLDWSVTVPKLSVMG